MPNGSYSLGEAAARRAVLRLACPSCGRKGQYRIDRLLDRYGPDTALPDLRYVLARCPRRGSMSLNSMFAGAGRDLSGLNQESLARGITEGTAPVFANQYDTLAGRQQHAIDSFFSGGLGASAAGVGNATTGLGIAGTLPQINDQNAQSVLQAYAQKYGLPLIKLSSVENLLLPIASLGSQSQGTGTSTSTMQTPWYNTAISAALAAAKLGKAFGFGG